MGLLLLALVERLWSSAAQAIPFRLTVPPRSERAFLTKCASWSRAPTEPCGRTSWGPVWSARGRGRLTADCALALQPLIGHLLQSHKRGVRSHETTLERPFKSFSRRGDGLR